MTEHDTSSRILVGVDGSASSIDALRHGAEIAAAFDAPLEALITWHLPVTPDATTLLSSWSPHDDAEQVLAQAVEAAFGGTPPASFSATVRQGPAAATLIEESADAGMLVLGSRGHGGFVGMLLGSVSSQCAAHAHCPVLIMHGATDAAQAG
jgi:nucleotide-binding universal stress UspA family protein